MSSDDELMTEETTPDEEPAGAFDPNESVDAAIEGQKHEPDPDGPDRIDPGMWRKICEQHKHVKAAARDLNAANAEVRGCRKDLDLAHERLGILIEQADSGQTQLFDPSGKPDEAPPDEPPDEPPLEEVGEGEPGADMTEEEAAAAAVAAAEGEPPPQEA